jgi:hypothetical protein
MNASPKANFSAAVETRERLTPPFTIGSTDESFWVEDAAGNRFGYVYFRDQPIVGTDRSGRLSRQLAERTVKWIARQATAWAGQ